MPAPQHDTTGTAASATSPAPPGLGRHLLGAGSDIVGVVEALGGLNAQTPRGPAVGLRARIPGLDVADLDALLRRHALVRANLMRGTVHLVTARQFRTWRLALQPALERTVKQFCPRLWDRVDHDDLLAAATEVLAGSDGTEGLTRGDIDAALRPRFPDAPEGQLGFAIRLLAPVVQVPDETTWRAGRTRYVLAGSVLSDELAPATEGVTDLLCSYLRVHGPASAADATYCTGLTGLAAPLRAVGTVVGGTARAPLLDLADPHHDPVPHAVVLPEYDSVWFGHKAGPCQEGRRALIPNTATDMLGSILVDGALAGAWRPRRDTVELVDQSALPEQAATVFSELRRWYETTSAAS